MARRKRKTLEIFSISFLDCICCGFGAVLLLFFLTIGSRADLTKRTMEALKKQAESVTEDAKQEANNLKKTQDTLEQKTRLLDELKKTNKLAEIKMRNRKELLLLLLNQQSTMEDALKKLIDKKKSIPTVKKPPPIPIPNEERRQYLTGFKLEGRHILFLVECSGGMLDDTIEGAIAKTGEPAAERKKAPKWQRTIHAVHWLIDNLNKGSDYQVMLFNNQTLPILPDRETEWFDPKDRKTTAEVMAALNKVVPHGGANLERAFETAQDIGHIPDSIVLLTDGLPTLSDSYAPGSTTNDRDRERMFRYAERVVPPHVPVNTILYQMAGDPGAAMLFWILANETHGALVSPSETWPNT